LELLSVKEARGTNDTRVEIDSDVTYLNPKLRLSGMEDIWSVGGAVVSQRQLDYAKEIGLAGANDVPAVTALERVQFRLPLVGAEEVDALATELDLHSAIERIRALVQEIFGEAAYVAVERSDPMDAEAPPLVVEAHYCFDQAEERFEELTHLHAAFLRRYVEEVPGAARQNLTLLRVPTDADEA
jgi:hypothetical protein